MNNLRKWIKMNSFMLWTLWLLRLPSLLYKSYYRSNNSRFFLLQDRRFSLKAFFQLRLIWLIFFEAFYLSFWDLWLLFSGFGFCLTIRVKVFWVFLPLISLGFIHITIFFYWFRLFQWVRGFGRRVLNKLEVPRDNIVS